MSTISLKRKHRLGLKGAREAARKVAEELEEAFDMRSEWSGNTLNFARSGVNGHLVVTKDSVSLEARLGLLLSAFKPRIEEQVNQNFEKYFG